MVNVRELIDTHEIISFDIFDTLLLRPYVEPTDLFSHIELLYNRPGFKKERIAAEKSARQKIASEITLQLIYNEIGDSYKDLLEVEILLESSVLKAHPQIKEIYDYAIESNKKIIVTSDMYLPKDLLIRVLSDNGYSNYHKFYLSSEIKLTKHSGELYHHIVSDLKTAPASILHIGDNYHTDYRNALKAGLHAFHINKVSEILFNNNPRAKLWYKKSSCSFTASVICAIMAYPHNMEYYYDFGYNQAGPVLYFFMNWLNNKIADSGIEDVLFIARDGYTLQKIFELLKPAGIRTHYVYINRYIKTLLTDEQKAEEADALLKYIKNITVNEKIALVDSVTENFSAQSLFEKYNHNRKLKGFYWIAISRSSQYDYETVQAENHFTVKNWNIMEFFMTSPEAPAKAIQGGQPVYWAMSPNEEKRSKIYPFVSNGAVGFARIFKHFFNEIPLNLSLDSIIMWVNILNILPFGEDKKRFKDIKHATDPAHSSYKKLFSQWYGRKKIIRYRELLRILIHK